MQQTIEDSGRQHLVAGKQLGPVADALVRRDDDGAAPVAVRDQPEEQAGLLAVHRLEAQLIDDQKRHIHVATSSEPGRRHSGIRLQGGHQLVEAVVHTEKPCSTALVPSAMERCVFPTPGEAASECPLSCGRGYNILQISPAFRRTGRSCRPQPQR